MDLFRLIKDIEASDDFVENQLVHFVMALEHNGTDIIYPSQYPRGMHLRQGHNRSHRTLGLMESLHKP